MFERVFNRFLNSTKPYEKSPKEMKKEMLQILTIYLAFSAKNYD